MVVEGAHVGEERVEPDVGHVALVEGQRDAPVEPGLRAGDAEVADRLPEKRQDLPAVGVRRDQVRSLVEERHQALLVGAHTEEIVLLGDLGRCHAVVRAHAVDELALLVEPLAPEAVETPVAAEIDVALGVDVREHPSH
jgi:hypothetical protein